MDKTKAKMKMKTLDFTESNIAKLAELFPNCVTETQDDSGNLKKSIDFDLLRQELSDTIVEGPQERFRLDWPGKKQALLTANLPIEKTLRPCREESVDFDNTKNLFIEGDNLNALKLLQETYLGKVKMIYIDPPYNTGNDFIYKDDFAANKEEYLRESCQKNGNGERLFTNTDSNGRFHSDWCSMMYSRLKVARNLLRDDGVIFVSIDENEVVNLSKIMGEIYGAGNFIANFVWQNKQGGGNDSKFLAVEHEYIIMYAKNISKLPKLFQNYDDEYLKRYKEEDEEGKYFWDTFKRKSGKQYYPIKCPDGTVLECDEKGNPISWLRSEKRFLDDLKQGEIKFEKRNDGHWSIFFKQRLPCGKKPRSILKDMGKTSDGSSEILKIFGKNIFSNPKPTNLIKYLISIVTDEGDIVLDFFAGSGTTADATIQLNAKDNGSRRYILIQIPERLDSSKKEYKIAMQFCKDEGMKPVISELAKERIRRARAKIKEENPEAEEGLDTGFRVLKVDSTNMKNVYYRPEEYTPELFASLVENIKEDRTAEDLLFQVMLDWGMSLDLPITCENIGGNDVFFVDDSALVACFAKKGEVTKDFCKKLIERIKKDETLRVVFRDAGFKDDNALLNSEQIIKAFRPHTEMKIL